MRSRIITIKEFQFLVGTLKTSSPGPGCNAPWQVSIPRRYAKNVFPLLQKPQKSRVSIPRRYAKNDHHLVRAKHEEGVSIPRRYAKNHFVSEGVPSKCTFQFLVGTLKTYCYQDGRETQMSFNSS